MLSFYGELIPTTNVGDFLGDFENDRKRFGGNAKSGCHKARR